MNGLEGSARSSDVASVLLVGPYDPNSGEYTFLSPPLGVWRLCGFLRSHGVQAAVFDPNCCDGPVAEEFARALRAGAWDVIGFSTTGMTLCHDLALAHLARRLCPDATLVAGGMEATFNPGPVLGLGPFDLAILGEGERPLLALARQGRGRRAVTSAPGVAFLDAGALRRVPHAALSRTELRDAVFLTPYEEMPYERYWARLEQAYRVGELPAKADREARLAEVRSVRLITLNYCPMGCTFCSSTNFLNEAQGSTVQISRLDADECVSMLRRIVRAHPKVRTVIFQDDIFVFTSDDRVLPLCAKIVEAKKRGELPRQLSFISTNRIDAMTRERLVAMKRAGFRVLGFGVESMAPEVLVEFGKGRIYPFIEPVLASALELGITPFLDLILTSPHSRVADLAQTIRGGFRWTVAGCEAGMYPYVIPFSGAPLSSDTSLAPHTVYARREVAGTAIAWNQAAKILPIDPVLRDAILRIEASFEEALGSLESDVSHVPSRVRSLLWIASAVPVLEALGEPMPRLEAVLGELERRLPVRASEWKTEIVSRAGVEARSVVP